MGDTGMRGTTADQDSRFANKEAIALKQTKFPKHFSEKVDLRKVNISVLRPWIATKVTTLIGIEDDIVVEFVFGMLEDRDTPVPDPRKMQISLTGFMDKYGAAEFMDKLWTLLLSAQATVGGVPAEFIAAKKAELERKQQTDKSLQDQMLSRQSAMGGREAASDSFDRRRPDRPIASDPLPPRPGRLPERGLDRLPARRSPPPRDDGYRRGPPPRRFENDNRERDRGYGSRYPGPARSRSRSPPGRYRRRSPSPRRWSPSPPPRRRRSPSPRRRSPSPKRQRERSITPPLRAKRVPSRERENSRRREDTPPTRRRRSPSPDSRSPSPPPKRKATRGRSKSRTPTPDDTRSRSISPSGSRSRDRSPTITPPAKRARSRSVTPTPPRRKYTASPSRSPSPVRKSRRSPSPRRRRRSSVSLSPRRRSPSPRKRIDSPSRDEEGVVKKGRGRFTLEDEAQPKKTKLDGPLKKSKWAQDD